MKFSYFLALILLFLSFNALADSVSSGAGYTIAGNKSDSKKEDRLPKIKNIILDAKTSFRVLVSTSLMDQLSKVKQNKLIEVEIYLNNETYDKSHDGYSGRGYVDFKGSAHILPIETNNKSLSNKIKSYAPTKQLQVLDQKLKSVRRINKTNRRQHSEKMFNNILHNILDRKILTHGNLNKDTGILNLKLSKDEIIKLSKYPSIIESITLTKKANTNMETAFNEIKLSSTSYPVNQYGGNGIGIYMAEFQGFDHPCYVQSQVEPIEDLIGLGGGQYTKISSSNSSHAAVVAQSLRMTSPESHIYCSSNIFSIPNSWGNKVNIVNYSWEYIDDADNPNWTSADTSADMHAYYDEVQLFIGSGNGCDDDNDKNGIFECFVGSPAKSHNAITVGAYNDLTDKMGDFSDWSTLGIHPEGNNSFSDYIKPEVLAPGVDLSVAGSPLNNLLWSGTSFSSPMVAGVAASMLSKIPSMKNHQALIKAATIAMATKKNIGNNVDSERDNAVGIQWNPYINWRWWNYPNSFLDNADGQWMEIDQRYLSGGWDVKSIFSWSNRTNRCDGRSGGNSYNGPDDYLCMDLDFKVVDPNGTTKLYSGSYSNNFEGGIFHTNISGNYKFYVKRYTNWYEWTRSWWFGGKTYHKNRAKLGLATVYIVNR